MNEENAFLPHFLDEEIYIIDENISTKETVQEAVVNKPVQVQEISKQEISKVEEPSSIYEKPQVDNVTEEVKAATLTYKGQNTSSILLIVNSILPEEQAFLEKVLGAVKLSINSCALLQLSENSSFQHHELIERFESSTFINFGSQGLPFLQNINNYKITFIEDKKILQSDDLKSIMTDVTKKKQLWECLQQLF